MKTILIAGSNSDIGMGVARALSGRDVNLVLHYHSNRVKADRLAACLDDRDCEYSLYQGDLAQPENAKAMIGHAIERFGRLDVLINIIGPFGYKNILDVTPAEWLGTLVDRLQIRFGFVIAAGS